ncbi:hypothetical protein [Roseibium sp.]|uniref:hypothetical protein n=2 Tax=Stappiaceae TaxID=2821832 RepID=UPI00326651DC
MTAMTEELKACKEEHRRLKAEILRLEAAPRSPAQKLRLLVCKRDLQDLMRRMRQQQQAAGEKMSRSTTATQVIGAYSRTVDTLKKQGR